MDASPIKNRRTILILLLASLGQLAADQPIMNMMVIGTAAMAFGTVEPFTEAT